MKQLFFLLKAKGRFLKIGFLALALSISLSQAFSATIYIDPSYTGSYQNGSSSNPYNSWSKFSINSGNTYLQKAGTSTSSGSFAFTGKNNITFGSYGTGAKPRITKPGTGNAIFYITGSYNITIKDLEITSTGSWVSGITIQGSSSSNNLIKNVWIHKTGWGIRLLTTAAGNRILNSKINDIMDDGIFVQDARNIEIGWCNITDVNKKYLINPAESYAAGDGIQLNSNNNLYFNIHHNTIDHSSMGNKFCFYVWGNNYNGKLEFNTFIANSSKKSNGVFFNATSNKILVRNNTFKAGYYGIISYANLVDVNYNRFSKNTVGILINPGYDLNARNNVFYNNTKYGISASYGTFITLKNNVFNLSASPAKAFFFMGQVTSNNNVYNTQYSGFINGYASLNAWRNSSGNDNSSVVGNPAFRNPSSDDFHIGSGSVAINRGQNVNLSVDYYGNIVPQQGNPDAGIHEYPGSKSEMIVADTTTIIPDSTAGLLNDSFSEARIYPNPSADGLFRIGGVNDGEDILVEAFDMSGNKLSESAWGDPESMTVDLSGNAPGAYLIRIQSDDDFTTLKAVIK